MNIKLSHAFIGKLACSLTKLFVGFRGIFKQLQFWHKPSPEGTSFLTSLPDQIIGGAVKTKPHQTDYLEIESAASAKKDRVMGCIIYFIRHSQRY